MASQALSVEPTRAITNDPDVQAVRSELLDEDEIAARAYELWHERGCPVGSPELDWFQAKEELKRRKAPIAVAV